MRKGGKCEAPAADGGREYHVAAHRVHLHACVRASPCACVGVRESARA
jgi:hypothetical protein